MTIRAVGTPAGVAAGLATGLIVGLFNGLITIRVGIPSFLTTLAMMGIATGVSIWASNTAAIPIIDQRDHGSRGRRLAVGSGAHDLAAERSELCVGVRGVKGAHRRRDHEPRG
jgi:ribose/xylose/arabinose/galactoside ABC-type transport system permease subunit